MAAAADCQPAQDRARSLFNKVYVGEDGILAELQKVESAASGALDAMTDVDGRRAVHWAASGNQQEILSELIRMNCDVNARDESGWSPLHCAVSAGAVACVEALLQAGADVNSLNSKKQLPLHLAKGRLALIESLLPGTKDCDASDHMGYTPLLRAVLSGSQDAVHTLLAAGAEVNAKTHTGDGALHLAASLNAEALSGMASLLIQAGAAKSAKNDAGLSGGDAVKSAQQTFQRLGGRR